MTNLDVEAGAGAARIVLPVDAGRTDVHIHAGVGQVEVTVPEGVAIRIRSQGLPSSLNVDETRFPRSGEYYESPDYDVARDRIDLDFEAGAGSLVVR